jgi:hypothetical protein
MAGTLRLSNTGTGNGQSTITTAASGDTTYTLPSGGGTFVTTSSTQALTVPFASGTASAPSVTFLGDSNTGIYSPGADQVAVATNGTQRLLIDSSGNISLGSLGAPAGVTNLRGSSYHQFVVANDLYVDTTPLGGQIIFRRNAGASESMRIDGSGRLGIGTSSPNDVLHVEGTIRTSSSSSNAQFANNFLRSNQAGTFYFDQNSGSQDFAFRLSNVSNLDTTAMTIKPSGRVGIGTTAPVNVLELAGNNSAGNGIGNVQGILRVNNNTTAFGSSPTAGIVFATKYRTSPDIPLDGAAIYGGKENTSDANKSFFLAFATRAESGNNGNEAMRIDSQGRVGIGTTTPSDFNSSGNNLVISGTGNVGITIDGTSTTQSNIYFADGPTGSEAYRGYISYDHNTDSMRFGSAAVERARIDSSGRLLVGTSTNIGSQNIQIGTATGTLALYKFANNDDGGELTFATSRNGTVGSQTIVNNGDFLGRMFFRGSDGSAFIRGAEIACRVDSTPGANDMPGTPSVLHYCGWGEFSYGADEA